MKRTKKNRAAYASRIDLSGRGENGGPSNVYDDGAINGGTFQAAVQVRVAMGRDNVALRYGCCKSLSLGCSKIHFVES